MLYFANSTPDIKSDKEDMVPFKTNIMKMLFTTHTLAHNTTQKKEGGGKKIRKILWHTYSCTRMSSVVYLAKHYSHAV